MSTLSTRVLDGEFKAITKYANASGLSVSELMKKYWFIKFVGGGLEIADERLAEMYYADPERNLNSVRRLENSSINLGNMLGLGLWKLEIFSSKMIYHLQLSWFIQEG